MAANRNLDREARASRDRLRRYQARQSVHAHQQNRRRRDNLIAVVGLLVVVALAVVAQLTYFGSGPGMPAPTPSASPSASAADQNTGDVPSSDIAEDRVWTGTLTLNGDIPLGVQLDGGVAPQAASAFISLAQDGYYDGNACTRLTTGQDLKVVQCGAPNDTTSPDPGFMYGPVENAPADGEYPVGTIAIARAESLYSQSTQFFIVWGETTIPPEGGGYSVIGTVTSGLDRFVSEIADAGVADGGQDGAPAVATEISGVVLQ